jgi:glucokinase
LLSFFKERNFFESFIHKGRLSTILEKVPVKVVLNEQTALLGAAQYAREHA